jgi:hypothetical protein
MNSLTIVPSSITPGVRSFARDVSGGADPCYVPLQVVSGAVPADCFNNVRRQIEREGGGIQLGWAIWMIPQVMIEAEHHAVWRSPTGKLVDVSVFHRPMKRTLFVLDSRFAEDGTPLDNVRKALVDHPLVHEFIDRGRRRYEFLHVTNADVPVGSNIVMSKEDDARLFPNSKQFSMDFFNFAVTRRRADDPCICGSERKFKRCCGG